MIFVVVVCKYARYISVSGSFGLYGGLLKIQKEKRLINETVLTWSEKNNTMIGTCNPVKESNKWKYFQANIGKQVK